MSTSSCRPPQPRRAELGPGSPPHRLGKYRPRLKFLPARFCAGSCWDEAEWSVARSRTVT